MDTSEDATTITREVELQLDAAELWEAISDPEHLAGWLGDDVDVIVEQGAEGTITDDGVLRHVRFDDVVAHRRLSFTWWDPGNPDLASQVVFEIAGTPVGSRLRIVETLPLPTGSHARAGQGDSHASDARLRWEVRVMSLWACTVAAALASIVS